jgi:glycosyltransferase involved in cell wall biosynthesis
VPVVSTRVSAIPELIDSGVSGQLAEVDDVDGFATALSDIATDPALAQQLSDAGFDKVAQLFNQQRNIDELIALFERYVPGKVV